MACHWSGLPAVDPTPTLKPGGELEMLTGTDRQWIFWLRVGVMLRASQAICQSRLNWRVDRSHLDSALSSGCTCEGLRFRQCSGDWL